MDTALTAAVSGGSPPDVALVPDPGHARHACQGGTIKDLTSMLGGLTSNFGAAWNTLASYNGKQYGVWFKGANKNTIWYNPALFTAAGISVAADHVGAAAHRRRAVEGSRGHAVLAVHRRRLAGCRLLAERVPQDRRARTTTTSSQRTRSSGPIQR